MRTVGIVFGILAILWEIGIGLIYAFFIDYKLETDDMTLSNFSLVYITVIAIMILAGFGLVSSYIAPAGVSGMLGVFLIFALTLQNYIVYRMFFDKANIGNYSNPSDFSTSRYGKLTYLNIGNDIETSPPSIISVSLIDAMGCIIGMVVIFSAVIGRINLLGIFFLAIYAPFVYEMNNLLLYRFHVLDSGYALRAFAFGGSMGLIIGIINVKKSITDPQVDKYYSTRKMQTLALMGMIIILCAYPYLIIADQLNTATATATDVTLINAILVNSFLCIAASALGSLTSTCTVNYGKFYLHDVVFSTLAGVIAYSSSSDINFNPASPLAIGFGVSYLTSMAHSRIKKTYNQSGVIDSNSVIFNYLIPGFLAGIFSSIFQASALFGSGNQQFNRNPSRDRFQQGGFQLVGLILSLVFGFAGGALIGFLILFTTFFKRGDLFNDKAIYQFKKKLD